MQLEQNDKLNKDIFNLKDINKTINEQSIANQNMYKDLNEKQKSLLQKLENLENLINEKNSQLEEKNIESKNY